MPISSIPEIRTALILAGGMGTRCWPFATVRNKCAIPVSNMPNVRRLAEDLVSLGVSRLVVVTGYHPASIRAALLGVQAEVAFVESTGGTAYATLAGLRLVDDANVLVVFGDVATPKENLQRILGAGDADAALLWQTAPQGAGALGYEPKISGSRVDRIVGHDADATRQAIGIVRLGREIVPFLEANPGHFVDVPVGGMPPLEADLFQSINDWIRAGAEVKAVEATQFVVDIDMAWHIHEANELVTRHRLALMDRDHIHPTATIHRGVERTGFVHLGEGAELGNRAVVRGNLIIGRHSMVTNGPVIHSGAVIGDECRVSDYCYLDSHATIGNRCIVGHGAELSGVMLDGSYLWHYCEISGVVGQSVDIGAATVCGTLRFDDGASTFNIKGRKERPSRGGSESYFGDFSRTGVNVITMPGSRIGAYSCVGAGVVVQGDIPERTLRLLKQETIDRSWGPERYGW